MFSFKIANKYCYTADPNVASYIFTFSRHPAISNVKHNLRNKRCKLFCT